VAFRPDNRLRISLVSQGLSEQQAQDIWRPFLNWVAGSPGELDILREPVVRAMPARNWWDIEFRRQHLAVTVRIDDRPGADVGNMWWSGDAEQVGWFLHGYESAWLPASLLEQQEALADALFATSRHWPLELHFNKGLAGALAPATAAVSDTATNPAVLDAFALAIIGGFGPSAYIRAADLAVARSQARAIGAAIAELRKIAPEAGAYVSESSFFQPDWQRAYWGTNYPRLRAVKERYDPAGLFFVHHGVGSEDWSEDGFSPVAAR